MSFYREATFKTSTYFTLLAGYQPDDNKDLWYIYSFLPVIYLRGEYMIAA